MKVLERIRKVISGVAIFAMTAPMLFMGATPMYADQLASAHMPSVGVDTVAAGTAAWSNPGNTISNNGNFVSLLNNSGFSTATIGGRDIVGWGGRFGITPIYGPNKSTHYLTGSNYGFNLPENSVIEGVKVNIDRVGFAGSVSGLGAYDLSVNLLKGGEIVGNNYAKATVWPTAQTVASYGTGNTDLWGSDWTAADINSSDFGVALSVQNSALLPRSALVDYMSIDVYYSSAPVIEAHGKIQVEAASSEGAIVEYTAPSTTDDVDGVLPATCAPASGSTFPIGVTSVKCDKTDAAGNAAISTYFDVKVEDTTAPEIPTLVGPEVYSILNPSGLKFKWSASTDVTGPVTYNYKSSWNGGSYGPVSTGLDNFIAVDGSADNSYEWQVQACDQFNNCSGWSGPWSVTLDSTPPILTLPASFTVEADVADGKVVTYPVTPSGQDLVDGVTVVECSILSESVFVLGTTTVTCTSKDTAGNTATGSFDVTVTDTTAPVITVPADFTVEADQVGGKVVTFPVSSLDIVDGLRPVVCSALSGSLFPVGDTTVDCYSKDSRNNVSTKSFVVTVKPQPVVAAITTLLAPASTVSATGVGTGIATGEEVAGATTQAPAVTPPVTTPANDEKGEVKGEETSPTWLNTTVFGMSRWLWGMLFLVAIIGFGYWWLVLGKKRSNKDKK
jgi:hypothetical protein